MKDNQICTSCVFVTKTCDMLAQKPENTNLCFFFHGIIFMDQDETEPSIIRFSDITNMDVDSGEISTDIFIRYHKNLKIKFTISTKDYLRIKDELPNYLSIELDFKNDEKNNTGRRVFVPKVAKGAVTKAKDKGVVEKKKK